jgi:nucleoid DNA-binding protein
VSSKSPRFAGFNAAAARVAARLGITKKLAREVIDAWRAEIVAITDKGERLGWPQLGVFQRRTRKGRNVMNPATHELMRLTSTTTLSFRASKHRKGSP